jgi:hypothetical protein
MVVRSTLVRVALVLIGIALLGAGWLAWIEEEKVGSGTDFSTMPGAMPGSVIVFETDEQDPSKQTRVFDGPIQEANRYMDERRAEGKSFIIPGLLLVLGGMLVTLGFVPWRRRHTAERKA